MKIQNCSQICQHNLASILCLCVVALPEKQAAWAENACQIGLTYLATILDFHSVGYRDHLAREIEKLEQLYFGLTGPNRHASVMDIFRAVK